MANILPPYIADLVLGFSRRSTEQLESLVALHPSHQAYLPLQNALNSVPEESINVKFIAPILANLPTDSRDSFGAFVIALLKYIRLPDGNDFESAHAKFQGLVSAYVEANKVFASVQDGIHTCACLNPIILALARRLLDLTEHAASLTPHVLKHPQSPRSMRDTTRQTLERSMQIATAHYNPDQWASANSQGPMVGDIIWEMGNILWRIFARRQLYSTAAELDRTFAKLRPREDDRIRARADYVRHTDICQTYYWRGRLGVKLLNFRGAKEWLDSAWAWCPEDSWQQRRAILIRLIPVNLLLGHLPDPALLRAYSLTHFSPLIHHFRTGNVAAWRRELDDKREWYRGRSIWLLLHERGEILVWRNLLRRALRTYYKANPAAPLNRCPTSVLLQTVRKAFEGTGEVEDGAVELEDIIIVIASCIDHGLILGYLSYSQNQLVMKPRPDGMGGFPAISTVTPRKIDANQ